MLNRRHSLVVIKETHRGLLYEDGVLVEVLSSGKYEIPSNQGLGRRLRPSIELVLVDLRERERLITLQDVLTADGVPVTVVLLARFRVHDPRSALHEVRNFEDRVQSDVHLAASQAIRSSTLESLLTLEDQIPGRILGDLRKELDGYGIALTSLQTRNVRVPESLRSLLLQLAHTRLVPHAEAERDPIPASVPFAAGQIG